VGFKEVIAVESLQLLQGSSPFPEQGFPVLPAKILNDRSLNLVT
jgi:hypothetical protein